LLLELELRYLGDAQLPTHYGDCCLFDYVDAIHLVPVVLILLFLLLVLSLLLTDAVVDTIVVVTLGEFLEFSI